MRIVTRGPYGPWCLNVACSNCGSGLEAVSSDVYWFNFGGHGRQDEWATAVTCAVCGAAMRVQVPDELEARVMANTRAKGCE